MKVAVIVLVLLPLAFCNPIGDLFNQLKKDIHLDVLKANLENIIKQVGTDATEAQCEAACHKIATAELLNAGCAPVCKTLQYGAKHFHLG